MYYNISKNEKNLFFGKKIAQVWAVTLRDYVKSYLLLLNSLFYKNVDLTNVIGIKPY